MANDKIQKTIKSTDTEETIDIYWTRPIGYLWAKLFEKLGVHPNTVTVLSMILGAAAGICFFFPSYRLTGTYDNLFTGEAFDLTAYEGLAINIIGVCLLAWANFYDSADGQLARMTGKKTKLGRILDGAAGDVWYIFIYFALVFRLWNQNIPLTDMTWDVLAFFFVAVDGFLCHPAQCRISDYYRNIHLFFLKGNSESELDNYPAQKAAYDQLSWTKNFLEKFFQMFYINWCKNQAKETPEFQNLMAKLQEKYGNDIPQDFRDRFRQASFPILKYTNFLTFNWRANFLYISCLFDLPWLVILIEMFVFSAVRIYMNHTHETFCKRLAAEL